jgi:hypothetical protein
MRKTTIGRVLVCGAVILVVMGGNQAVGAPTPSAAGAFQEHGLAGFEWYKLSQLNANVISTIYADVGEYLVADQPAQPPQTLRRRASASSCFSGLLNLASAPCRCGPGHARWRSTGR